MNTLTAPSLTAGAVFLFEADPALRSSLAFCFREAGLRVCSHSDLSELDRFAPDTDLPWTIVVDIDHQTCDLERILHLATDPRFRGRLHVVLDYSLSDHEPRLRAAGVASLHIKPYELDSLLAAVRLSVRPRP